VCYYMSDNLFNVRFIRITNGFDVAALTLRCVNILSGCYLYVFVTRDTID